MSSVSSVRIMIDQDEWWPVYSIIRADGSSGTYHYSRILEMSSEDVERFERIEKDFMAAQKELAKILDPEETK